MAAMPSPSSVADTSKVFETKKPHRNCVVRFCSGSGETGEKLVLFTFPKQLDLRIKWAENLQMPLEDITKSFRVCERHFEPRCMASQRLVENAVPTLELGYDYPPPHVSGQLTGKGWRKCSIPNCKSNENVVYHRVPKEGPVRRSWLRACGLPQDNKDRYICGIHFPPDIGNKKRLPAGVVPTFNLVLPSNFDDNSCHWGFDDESLEWWEATSKEGYDNVATSYEFDPSISEEERRFYLKAYPTVDAVRERKVHCTVCKNHIGSAPALESSIKMHPILRVTHCMKCHDFYNSGEFSKGEDGSELYCRWCGQGGEVYCCSSCPYVFCKSCIVKNLSKGVVADIEQNENWNCFSCAPKILWPLRAQHWALMNYIDVQKKEIGSMNLPELEYKARMSLDRSKCCRLAKAKLGNMSDSMESLDSVTSKRSQGSSSGSAKKSIKHPSTPSPQHPSAKRAKPNDEVVCTPDLLSMLEPDCQLTVAQKNSNNQRSMASISATSTPRVLPVAQQPYSPMGALPQKNSAPPPLVLRNTAIKLRPNAPAPIVRRTVIGPRTPMPGTTGTPVYHTINGYRIDLNSAAQQETFRLPNGKLIQVKRQGPPPGSGPQHGSSPTANSWQIQTHPSPQQLQRVVPQTIASRPVQITAHPYPGPSLTPTAPQHAPGVRYHSNVMGGASINVNHNGSPLQVLNGQITAPQAAAMQQQQHQQQQQQQQVLQQQMGPNNPHRPVMVRHIFPDNPIGSARTQLQEQVFSAMEICTHLTSKVQSLTNSNAYKQAKNQLEVKELYIHLSYLLTYAIGRFKGLQDKCLADMRKLGFVNDADSLENGQLAAAIDYVCYGQLEDVDLFNTGTNSFHNQVYEYRKSLHANLKDGEDGSRSPLPPLFALGEGKSSSEVQDEDEDSLLEPPQSDFRGHWLEGGDDSNLGFGGENDENEEPDDMDDDDYSRGANSYSQGTEESMRRNEESHLYDRKLTRLIAQYPSIWCTRHPDYGNFEVTRKHWRTIEAHFARSENIKLRWKNIRKRFVRIEKRIATGKRFNGHFDKAMAFLANRDLPEDQWLDVDCGEDDGDTFDRQNLDALEKSLHHSGGDADEKELKDKDSYSYLKPIDIEPLDLKIITFVKTNPVLWRKSMDPEADKIDEQTRKTVWRQLAKTLKTLSADYIRDRWQHLYEMYKTFRLKTIKSSDDRSNLELKYSKYLAKLYFLYKIDEQELRNENNGLFEDCFELDDDDEEAAAERVDAEDQQQDADSGAEDPPLKLQDMPDDKEFLHKLVRYVREYPAIWNTKHDDYNDIMVRDNYWQDIQEKLAIYKHKQASDDEDNEIEIVEPKTDLINLDSDEDEPPPPKKKPSTPVKLPTQKSVTQATQGMPVKANQTPQNIPLSSVVPPPLNQLAVSASPQIITTDINLPGLDAVIAPLPPDDTLDLMTMAQSFLASMLEVDITEGAGGSGSQSSPNGSESTQVKKQPRKKTTNKPNPTLLKQKARMELERLEEIKRNDLKLKMKCAVKLKKAEEEFPFVKEKLKNKWLIENQLSESESIEKVQHEKEKSTTVMLDMGKETLEVQLVIVDDNLNSSGEGSSIEEIKDINGMELSNNDMAASKENNTNKTDENVGDNSTGNDSEMEVEKPKEKLNDSIEETVTTIKENGNGNGNDEENCNGSELQEDENEKCKENIELNKDSESNADGGVSNKNGSDKEEEEEEDNQKGTKKSEESKKDDDVSNENDMEVDEKPCEDPEPEPEASKKDDSLLDETVEDISMEDIGSDKSGATNEINSNDSEKKESDENNEEFKEESVSKEKNSEINQKMEEDTEILNESSEKVASKPAATLDIEDAEVYEEIEKVLQHRRDSDIDDNVKEQQTAIVNDTESEEKQETTKESLQPSETTTATSAKEIEGSTSSKSSAALDLKDKTDAAKECNSTESPEQSSNTTATITKDRRSSKEVTSNGNV